MRLVSRVVSLLVLGLGVIGCSSAKNQFDGPMLDEFTGRLTAGGKPVSFPEGENVSLTLFHEKGKSLGIPIQSDGTWKITGWMPTGKFSVILNQPPKGGPGRGPPGKYNVPGGLTIEEGKTDYTIDLGKDWQP
jgi:hypothetical protein